MTERRAWETLSPAYRKRLQHAGVTETAYTAGASLQAARGHAATPERPERAVRNVPKYSEYLRRRAKTMRVITTEGVLELRIPDPRERSTVGRHENAVKNSLAGSSLVPRHGVPGGVDLGNFTGREVHGYPAGGDQLRAVTLLTEPDELAALYYTGELRYEQIYPQAG